MLKILYASDLHGSTLMFKKLINAALLYGADAIIVGGDITGKGILPVRKTGDRYETIVYGTQYTAKNEKEVSELFEMISNFGFYPHVFEGEEKPRELEREDIFEELFRSYVEKRFSEWAEFATRKLETKNIKIYLMPGNDDFYYVDTILDRFPIFINHDQKILKIGRSDDEYFLVGYSKTNITPWKCPRDTEEDELRQELKALLEKVEDYSRLILNTHCPPYNTTLDLAPLLDRDLKPVISAGNVVFTHVGCVSVREVIESYQPLLGLHGHIHESRGVEKIGRTVIINAGSAYNEGILYAAYIVLNKGKVQNIALVKG